MRQRIENQILVTVNGLDLMLVSDIEFYVKQGALFFEYSPDVLSETEMVVTMPLADAMKLTNDMVQLQFAYTDENGKPDAANPVFCSVHELLKEGGYGNV